MKSLEIVYASVTNMVIHYCLEFAAPSIPDGAYRLVLGYHDITAKLETGEEAIFQKAAFGLSLPSRTVKGRQDLNFNIDNVSGEVSIMIDNALAADEEVKVTLRKYNEHDLSAPAEPPIVMTAFATELDENQVKVSATFEDLVNTAFPIRRYTSEIARGLVWL
ncbi:DUF1833 family protein [Photobacterium atrarenae]|uniref:DUF1833 domain-containing protein n=1 Tax=Photobacterium atrarenae TaxID=865757 RepID=A0ABY5GLV6_9GAMM|nr:DUF1833 family protein [Photobacterium atrarenae]UTV30156.1 DUF1833 domain-containing protein [Photobacterium atrarenae]